MSRKKPDLPPPENHERWIVTYADMLTLLFALFVVLWSMSDTNPKKLLVVRTSLDRAFNVGVLSSSDGGSPIFENGGTLAPSITEIKAHDLSSISKMVGDFSSRNGVLNKIQVRSDADSITISLADNLVFDSGSAALKPGAQVVLDEVARIIGALPNQVRVEGHTDNVPVNSPDFATNWELSAQRAVTVLRFLSERGGLKPGRLFAADFADTKPVADNSTAEGRALNRRADIVIVYPTQEELERALAASGSRKTK